MPRVAVCLSGCGVFDGSEIHEAVLTMLALDQAGADIVCCAPNVEQAVVMDHLTRSPAGGQSRNVLVESARIARGNIVDLAGVKASQIDALIFPGGFGAAKNLCNFADVGPECSVHPQVERLVGEMLEAGKPIGAICIAPAMLARIVGRRDMHPRMTIGTDESTASAMEKMGVRHQDCPCESFVVDEAHKIVTTPAYMLGKGPAQVFEGIRRLVGEILRLA
ncbi:MAG: isoprenoid biosynthesis glyoxalase ElbB [Planctomycetes bacterium]|nr:isoprenoid biosynthesis glyoxalase ElbB [Planctomycetota bacterium]